MGAIKEAIDYTSVFDYYHINKKVLGKGTFGSVHTGVHKKTGQHVAIKVLTKKMLQPS